MVWLYGNKWQAEYLRRKFFRIAYTGTVAGGGGTVFLPNFTTHYRRWPYEFKCNVMQIPLYFVELLVAQEHDRSSLYGLVRRFCMLRISWC